MRVQIDGDGVLARSARGYLRRAGVAVVNENPDYLIAIEQTDTPFVTFYSVDCELELCILREVRRRTKSPVLISANGRESDRIIAIAVPDRNLHLEVTVAHGILQGVLESLRFEKPEKLTEEVI